MSRPSVWVAAVGVVSVLWLAPARAQDKDDAHQEAELRFLLGLREKGLNDLARDAMESLRKQPGTPAELKETLDYEIGRSYLEEGSALNDIERQQVLFEKARAALDAFVRAHPNHRLVPEALVQMARLLYERGLLAKRLSDDYEGAEKRAKLTEARAAFDQARKAYAAADERLQKEYDKFPKFIPKDNPDWARRDRAHNALMEAQLQRALVDYEEAQTYPPGSETRNAMLDRGIKAFEGLYNRYRTQMAGLTARAFQAKCYEERGDLGPALGIYNELMEHTAPELRPLQRKVGYFRIIALAKRKQFALAADEAVRWLQANPGARRSAEGVGVEFELAKNLIAQLPEIRNEATREAAIKKATDSLSEVVRYTSPFKAEAVELLKKYKPNAARTATAMSRLDYDGAMAQADQLAATRDWGQAIDYLKLAVRRADPRKDPDRANRARYNMSVCFYMSKRYYEADVVAEHLARNYPRNGLAAQAAGIGMAALAEAYGQYTVGDRAGDLNRLESLAQYTVKTWPDTDQADTARMALGQIALGQGRYPEAAKAFESVRPAAKTRAEGLVQAGIAHWKNGLKLRDEGDGSSSRADAEARKALESIEAAYKLRKEAGAPPTDPGLINNACEIAEIHLLSNRPDEALKALQPHAQALAGAPKTPEMAPVVTRLLSFQMRAHTAAGQTDKAIADMKAIEAAGNAGPALTQLYLQLGKLLEKQIDDLKRKGDQASLNRTSKTYQQVLEAMAKSQAGQTFESLAWAGEALLGLESYPAAARALNRALDTYGKDPQFLRNPKATLLLRRVKIKLVTALAGENEFEKAQALLDEVKKESPNTLEPLMAEGELHEEEAKAGKGTWVAAANFWKNLAGRLGRQRHKPEEYYEAWYRSAYALAKQGKPELAVKTLKSVMKLSPTVGGPEMKAKYNDLLRRLQVSTGHAMRSSG